jgi:SAM-dependent methyltransferase
MTNDQSFTELVDIYEALVDWSRRLAHEEPFYRRLFAADSVRRLADVACGTGHHAAMFHRWGLTVEGSDVSPAMIQRASLLHGQSETLRWTVRGFDQVFDPQPLFDAAICVGNSLALAGTRATADRVIGRMLAAVRPGGLAVVHVLNLWHLPDGPCQWQKCRRMTGPDGELLVVKGVHRSGASGYVDLIVTALDETPRLKTESVPLLGLEADALERAARRGGATQVDVYGGYDSRVYERETSADLIMVARRGE